MTTMTNIIENNSYWSNNILDQLFDIDQLFASNFDFNYNRDYDQHCILMKEEYEETGTSSSSSSSSETDHNQLQSISSSTSIDLPQQTLLSSLVCGVCGAPASGYNFDQITCESCKAFFRRNALRNMPNRKCRFTGSCVIDIRTRRKCTYCRLKKCFDINMRKDWIRTDEERQLRQLQKLAKEQRKLNKVTNPEDSFLNLPIVVRKKKRLMLKPTVQDVFGNPILTEAFFGVNRNLSNNDRILLNNITNAYQLGADKADYSHINTYASTTPFSKFLNDESIMHSSLIWYYKSIPDFKQLDLEDQVLLIKSNLINIIHLHHIIVQNFQDDPKIGEHMSNWFDPEFHYQMSETRRYFYHFTKYPLLLKLTLAVFIFSMNLSIPDGSSQYDEYKDSKRLHECQNHYTTILWRYLTHLFDEKEAICAMKIIVTQILRYQKLMMIMKNRVQHESNHDILHSLMQSIFGLS